MLIRVGSPAVDGLVLSMHRAVPGNEVALVSSPLTLAEAVLVELSVSIASSSSRSLDGDLSGWMT